MSQPSRQHGVISPADGTVEQIGDKHVLRFERWYPHPVERVWRAVTAPDEMVRWFPSAVEGERAVGAALTFADEAQRQAAIEAGEPTRVEGPMFTGRVTVWDPPAVFSFTWGSELLRYELAPDGDGTRLVFTQVLSHPSLSARNGAGWHACLGALDALLLDPADAGAAGDDGVEWPDVYQRYQERLGPPLGEPVGDGALRWERAVHVDGDRVLAAVSDPAERAAWGAGGEPVDDLTWETEPAEVGCVWRLTHRGIGQDAERAARWHALLIQLDLYLAAGVLVPVDPAPWVERYRALLG